MIPTSRDNDCTQSVSRNARDLMASYVKGSVRQLFNTSNDTPRSGDNQESDSLHPDFLIRPNSTRSQRGLCSLVDDIYPLPVLRDNTSIGGFGETEIVRIDSLASKDYFSRFSGLGGDRPSVPVIISGSTDDYVWKAGHDHWSPRALLRHLGPDVRLEVAQSNSTVSLGDYVSYLESGPEGVALDDDPVYIFETLIDGEHDSLIEKFNIPKFFTDMVGQPGQKSSGGGRHGCHSPGDLSDLFSVAGDDGLGFGVHRWIIMGPRGSGSNLHIDPLGTSAWNTLVAGTKLWVLFPPSIDESLIKPRSLLTSSLPEMSEAASTPDFCAAGWFVNVLPRFSDDILSQRIQVIQREGETIYVPAGWHHAVLNLELSVCVTQNFASPCHYPQIATSLYSPAGGSRCNSHEENDFLDDDENEDFELIDEWRENIPATWPSLRTLVEKTCVHCGLDARGNRCILLNNRPVCKPCEKLNVLQYELISAQQVEVLYGLQMWKLSKDDAPVSVMQRCRISGKESKHYLHSQVRELEIFGIPIKNCKLFKRRSLLKD